MPAFLTPPPRSGKQCEEELDAFLSNLRVEPDCITLWQAVSGMDDDWWYELTDEDKATKIHPYDSDCAAPPRSQKSCQSLWRTLVCSVSTV